MKYLVRQFVQYAFALWLASEFMPGFDINNGWKGVILASLVLAVLMILIKPLLKILFIPVNIMTFGLLSWAVNVIVVYLLAFLAPVVNISSWDFPGISQGGFSIPPFHISYIASLIVVSLVITLITNILQDVSES